MYKDFFEGPYQQTPPIVKPLSIRILIKVLIWTSLIGLGVFSFIFPPLGIPLAVLMYHSGKKRYALFPTLGILALIFLNLYNQIMILLTR
jgi:hypothetical protein